MKRPISRRFWYTVVAFLLLAVVCFEAIAQSESDPVLATLKAYEEATDEFRKLENLSSDARVAFWRKWQEHFETVVDQNPQSSHIEAAKPQLLGLYNGLGEFDQSQKILREIVSHASNMVEKIYWYNQSGEVCLQEYLAKKDRSEAQKSLVLC